VPAIAGWAHPAPLARERDDKPLAAARTERTAEPEAEDAALEIKQGVALARKHGLRMQTHLDEQRAEKALIEDVLYPDAGSYTGVYARDGLLDCEPILAHCIHLRPEELDLIAATASSIAHCPVSNTMLGSGVMPLDVIRSAGIPHALCTDVGASPTTSLFCEMAQFLKVHAGSSLAATPEEA